MTSRDSLSHLEPDDITSNHNSNALNKISDDVDERSPHVDILIVVNLMFAGFSWIRLIVERGGEEGERKGGKIWEEKEKRGEGESENR